MLVVLIVYPRLQTNANFTHLSPSLERADDGYSMDTQLNRSKCLSPLDINLKLLLVKECNGWDLWGTWKLFECCPNPGKETLSAPNPHRHRHEEGTRA